MIILGIDPGTASTGYGVIKTKKGCKSTDISQLGNSLECLGYGLIKTTPDLSTGNRLKKLSNELSRMIAKYRPEILVIESIYFFKNLKTAIPVSQASGVVFLMAAKKNIPIYSLTPLQVKMTIAGHGWAEKEKVQEKMKKLLRLKEIPKPDDAADALAIALTYFLKNNLLTLQCDSASSLRKSKA
ncbi:MAG: crossover junction endodeoxyribonuclease RuvC [Patescibacteria group bacterium]